MKHGFVYCRQAVKVLVFSIFPLLIAPICYYVAAISTEQISFFPGFSVDIKYIKYL